MPKLDILMIHIILIAVLVRVIQLVLTLEPLLFYNTGHFLHIQLYTHVAQVALVRRRLVEIHKSLPLKIFIVGDFVLRQVGQKRGQILWTCKVKGVDVGRTWHPEIVLCFAHDHRHYIILQHVKKLLCYVVSAHRVLKGKKELVRAGNVLSALRGLVYLISVKVNVVGTLDGPFYIPINGDIDIVLEILNVKCTP